MEAAFQCKVEENANKESHHYNNQSKLKEYYSHQMTPVKGCKDDERMTDKILHKFTKEFEYCLNKVNSHKESVTFSVSHPIESSSSGIVSVVNKDDSNIGDDTLNYSIHQYFSDDSKDYNQRDSPKQMNEFTLLQKDKRLYRQDNISKLDEVLKIVICNDAARNNLTKLTSIQKQKSKEPILKSRSIDSSNYDTEEDIKQNQQLLIDFKASKNSKKIKQTRSTMPLSNSKEEVIGDQSMESEKNFQLHQIIFNNSLNKDLSKFDLNETDSPIHSTVQSDEPLVNEQFCIESLFGKVITLSPELKFKKAFDQDDIMGSQFNLNQNENENSNTQLKEVIYKLPLVTLQVNQTNNNDFSSMQSFGSQDNEKEASFLTNYGFIKANSDSKAHQAQTEVFKEENMSSPIMVMSTETIKNSTSNIKSSIPSLSSNLQNSSKQKLSEDELFIRFNKRGWICAYCHNFNFEGKVLFII